MSWRNNDIITLCVSCIQSHITFCHENYIITLCISGRQSYNTFWRNDNIFTLCISGRQSHITFCHNNAILTLCINRRQSHITFGEIIASLLHASVNYPKNNALRENDITLCIIYRQSHNTSWHDNDIIMLFVLLQITPHYVLTYRQVSNIRRT